MSLSTALRTRRAAELPSRRDELWRYSDLRATLRAVPPPSPEADPYGHSPFAALEPLTTVVVNGRTEGPTRRLLGSLDGAAAPPTELRFLSDATGTGHSAKLAITVMAGAQAVLLESYEGRGSAYASDVRLDIEVGEGARLERIVLTDEPADAVSVATAYVAVEAGAHFAQTLLATGARLQRLETHVRNPGEGASVRLDGVYLLDGRRQADLTTVVTHEGVGGATSQLTKGVVADAARGVFQGRIIVRPGADGTDARMGHHALLLSDRAEVDARPELEIFADDVACAHGNTVGALDQDALFYARSRGVPERQARAMLTEAFLAEVTDRIEHLGARDLARAWVELKLRGLS